MGIASARICSSDKCLTIRQIDRVRQATVTHNIMSWTSLNTKSKMFGENCECFKRNSTYCWMSIKDHNRSQESGCMDLRLRFYSCQIEWPSKEAIRVFLKNKYFDRNFYKFIENLLKKECLRSIYHVSKEEPHQHKHYHRTFL